MISGERDVSFVGVQPHPPVVELFSARLRRWRHDRGIPLKRVAADLGVSTSVISAWENGEYFPSAAHLEQLSAYSGVPVCQFFYPEPGDCPNHNCSSAPHP
jgi:transcriptional regulator with XRE-family HTH domain